MWRLLRTNRRFRRLFLAETVTNFGETAVYLSLAIWVKDLTGSNAGAGIVFLAIAAPGLAGPLLGHLVDRVRRRPLMIRMYLVMAVLFLTLLAVHSADQVWIIYAVAFAYGVLSTIPARPALLKDFLPSEDAAPARSLLFSASEGVRIVSPAIGAGIYVAFGGSSLAVLGAGTFVAAALLLASIDIAETPPEPAAGERLRTSVVAGFLYIRRVPLLLRLSLAVVAFMAVVGLLETAVFAANEGLGQQAAFLGVITSFQGGGSVLGGLLAGWMVQRWSEARSSSVGYALMAVGLLLCLLHDVTLFLAGVVFFGFGMPFVLIALGTAFHLYTPSRMQGRANAAVGSVTGLAQTMSIAAGVALIAALGYQVMYLAVACTAVLCAGSMLVGHLTQPDVVKSLADEDSADAAGQDGADGAGVDSAAAADVPTEPEISR